MLGVLWRERRKAAVIFGFGIVCFLHLRLPTSQFIGGMFEYAVAAFTDLGKFLIIQLQSWILSKTVLPT